ncbi:hypothetical protein [Sorangium sp. So ce1078]|uniref:hypothetical protein n=1 Tax=Sorangium sp. So ce1078 TaxID=3133329 RepID=UPI003F5F8B9C
MFDRIPSFAIVSMMTLGLGGCAVETSAPEDDAELGEAEEALTSCNAPINGHADWIEGTRTRQSWCPSLVRG